jgi:hypothetical protein
MTIQYHISTFSRNKGSNMLNEYLAIIDTRTVSKRVLELFALPMATNGPNDSNIMSSVFIQVQMDRLIPWSPHLRKPLPSMSGCLVHKRDHFAFSLHFHELTDKFLLFLIQRHGRPLVMELPSSFLISYIRLGLFIKIPQPFGCDINFVLDPYPFNSFFKR